MRVLVACEYSGRVRDAFAARGHFAMSCDLLPTESPGEHYCGDVRDVIGDGWDLLIAHPPCTYLCVSGIHWNARRPERAAKTEEALEFAKLFFDATVPLKCIENPTSIISTRIRKPDQIIQPYQFGHDASKATCLWLGGRSERPRIYSRWRPGNASKEATRRPAQDPPRRRNPARGPVLAGRAKANQRSGEASGHLCRRVDATDRYPGRIPRERSRVRKTSIMLAYRY